MLDIILAILMIVVSSLTVVYLYYMNFNESSEDVEELIRDRKSNKIYIRTFLDYSIILVSMFLFYCIDRYLLGLSDFNSNLAAFAVLYQAFFLLGLKLRRN